MQFHGNLTRLATASKGACTATAYKNNQDCVFVRITPGIKLITEDLAVLVDPSGGEEPKLRYSSSTVSLYEFPDNFREGVDTPDDFKVHLEELVEYLDGVETGTSFP